jgi:hypothetical protein
MLDIKLYVVTHKDSNLKNTTLRQKIYVGSNQPTLRDEYIFDSTFKNISSLNASYSELTALYWIWKNSTHDYIGLEHYRRFFLNNRINLFKYNLLSKYRITKLLKHYSVIVPTKIHLNDTLHNHYCKFHFSNDLILLKDVISSLYPDYIESYQKVFEGSSFFPFNMFISSKLIIDDYCKWLFEILFKLQSKIDLSSRDNYQKRVFGFLSERLFNVWIHKNKIVYKEIQVCFTEIKPYKIFLTKMLNKFLIVKKY